MLSLEPNVVMDTRLWGFSYTVKWSDNSRSKHCVSPCVRSSQKSKNRKQIDTNFLWTAACFFKIDRHKVNVGLYRMTEKRWNLRSCYEQTEVPDNEKPRIEQTNSWMKNEFSRTLSSNIHNAPCTVHDHKTKKQYRIVGKATILDKVRVISITVVSA